jgi:hypothetical protein
VDNKNEKQDRMTKKNEKSSMNFEEHYLNDKSTKQHSKKNRISFNGYHNFKI